MRIERIDVFRFKFSLAKPFTIALGSVSTKEVVIVRIEDNRGDIGWGEASPSQRILGSSVATTLAAMDALVPALLGEDPRRIGYLVERMDRVLEGNSAAKAALDIALHDLVGRILGEPLWRLLGGHTPGPVSTDFTVGIDAPEAMASEARALVERGFREIKIKVGEDPVTDLERVRRIREAVGDGIVLRIDANQGWTPQEALWALRRMAEYGVELVEQPVAAWDIQGLAWVRRHSPIPVMADEAAHSPRDALRLIQADAVDYINIKLMKSGGLWRAREIATICRNAGVLNMIGGMVETNLAATAATHLALSEGNIRFRDLDLGTDPEAQLIAEGGSYIRDGDRHLSDPEAPGLGIHALEEGRLVPVRRYTLAEGGGSAKESI
ncbi:MAG TPA: dipeptide epimerase [Candidatus Acetothermia bacterium]|nr:dipeptide epimerase [Candidatus Acetothermia bacterium]